MTIKPKYGQSNYDLSLQGYGSLESIVKMCRDNEILSIDNVENKSYYFDDNLVVDKNIIGHEYGTNVISNE